MVGVLMLTFWSVRQLAVSIVKTTAMEESQQMAKTDMYGGGMGPGYSNYCLTMPMYPPLSGSMMPGTTMTKEDQLALEKYNKEMEKYNAEYAAACRAEQEKQEKLKEKNSNLAWMGSVTVYSILSLFGIFATALTLMVIKKNEMEG